VFLPVDMSLSNRRRLLNENSNPLQRLVGGFVLFLIILMIYSFLKLVVIILGADPENYFPAEPNEQMSYSSNLTAESNSPTSAQHSGSNINPDNSVIARNVPGSSDSYSVIPKGIPKAFVFLDISGNPTEKDSFENVPKGTEKSSEEQWFVQFGNFRNEASAQRFLDKLKTKDVNAEVAKMGNRYIVRTPPNTDNAAVEEQLKKLRTVTNTKMMLKKIEPSVAAPVPATSTPLKIE
jgi:hypothetical protein